MSPIKTITQYVLAAVLILSIMLLVSCTGIEIAPGPMEETPVVDNPVDDFF